MKLARTEIVKSQQGQEVKINIHIYENEESKVENIYLFLFLNLLMKINLSQDDH